MTKADVEQQSLGAFVLMPPHLDISFNKWWRSEELSTLVKVRFPHEKHGNAGRISNSAKQNVRKDFIEFVDINSQPNGRSADSCGPTFYFLPKFSTIQTPKPSVHKYEERAARSVVGEFNRIQREKSVGECSNTSSHNWLKADRPKVAICPHQEDYCDTCSKMKISIHSKQTTINRLLQSANALPQDVKKLENEMKDIVQAHENHKDTAQKSHSYYKDVTDRCKEQWEKINSLESKGSMTRRETSKLRKLKTDFTLVICADYQMCKLVPYWGYSAQPGSTYYLQKLNHDVFGIVNHCSNDSTVYLFDERVGPKNTDHTLSYMSHFISKLPDWIRRVQIFLNNTPSTNKNYFTIG